MITQATIRPDQLVIQADGTFDVPAAERIARQLQDATADAAVRVDLTRVREFHDFGVAVLARALAARPEVDVRGLRTHQIRLLRYLGVRAGDGSDPLDDIHPV